MTLTALAPTTTDPEFAAIVDELTRRGFLAGGLGAAAGLTLAACGSDEPSAASSSPATRRRVDTMHGEIEIPIEPTRIVATDYAEVFALLDLGITPVGKPGWLPDFAPYTAKVDGVPVIVDSGSGKVVVEKVAALAPDLIVGDDWPGEEFVPFEELQRVAPTTLFALQPNVGNWIELSERTADAVGRSEEMGRLRTTYDDRAAALAARFADLFASTQWDVIDRNEDQWDLYGPASATASVLTHAGVRLGAGASLEKAFEPRSFEVLDTLHKSDVLVVASQDLTYLRKQPGFSDIPAVKTGRLVSSDLFFPASFGMALALLDDLERIATRVAAL